MARPAGRPAGRGRRTDRQSAVRQRAAGDQLGGPRDRGRGRRRVHRRRRRIDDPGPVRDGQASDGLGSWRAGSCQDTTLGWRFLNPKLAELHYPYTMGETAENVAERWEVGRDLQDAFALASQQKAIAAIEARPVRRPDRADPGAAAEGRPDPGDARRAPARRLLAPRLWPGSSRRSGRAARSPPATPRGINDGASAVLLVEAERARDARPAADGPRRLDGGGRGRSGGDGRRPGAGHAQGARAGRARRSTTSTWSSSTRRSPPSRSSASTSWASTRRPGQRQRRGDRARPPARDERRRG